MIGVILLTKILIADDEKITREYIKYIILENRMDLSIIEASNGVEALDKAKEFSPKIIFMDIRMPKMDGLSASERIKELLPDTKIIILTAHNEFSYAQTAVKIHVDDYILKPVNPETVLKVLNDYLSKIQNIKDISQIEKNIESAVEFIKKHYREKLSLKEVADYSGYSVYYFSKIFKRYTKLNFSVYLNMIRVEEAKKLMSDYELSIKEIAEKVGYEDFSYFSKVFKTYEGMVPREYRKILLK